METETEGETPRKRRPRKLKPNDGPPVERHGSPVVRTVELDGAIYEQRYIPCGPRCSRCRRDGANFDRERPGHGPYWYRFFRRKDGQSGRRYIGKTLEGGKK